MPGPVYRERQRCLRALKLAKRSFEKLDELARSVDGPHTFLPSHLWLRLCNQIRSGDEPITMEEQLFGDDPFVVDPEE